MVRDIRSRFLVLGAKNGMDGRGTCRRTPDGIARYYYYYYYCQHHIAYCTAANALEWGMKGESQPRQNKKQKQKAKMKKKYKKIRECRAANI